jgi:hypothetical protein
MGLVRPKPRGAVRVRWCGAPGSRRLTRRARGAEWRSRRGERRGVRCWMHGIAVAADGGWGSFRGEADDAGRSAHDIFKCWLGRVAFAKRKRV